MQDMAAMWRSLRRASDRYSLQEFRYQIRELKKIKFVDEMNKESILNVLQSIAEIVAYGDRHDPSIFECFMEYQTLAEFIRLLKICRNSGIEASILHYLSIMIQNLESDNAIYYFFSNDYINNIILHPYEFNFGDVASYYVSFLRTVSGKLNSSTIWLLAKVQEDMVISFPLYTEALKFAQNDEKMIQTAVRALTLDIYKFSDDMVCTYLTSPPLSEYFSNLVLNLREQCFSMNVLIDSLKDNVTNIMWKELILATEKFIDDLYYYRDVINIANSCLSRLMLQNLLNMLIIPTLLPALQSYEAKDSQISPLCSLYVLCCLAQVVDLKELLNFVSVSLLCPKAWSVRKYKSSISRRNNICVFAENINEEHLTSTTYADPETNDTVNVECIHGHSLECISTTYNDNLSLNDLQIKSDGVLSLIFSGNNTLMIASLMLLIVLLESKGLDNSVSSKSGIMHTGMEQMMECCNQLSDAMIVNNFVKYIPKILNLLLKLLSSPKTSLSQAIWTAGWILLKLVNFHEHTLTDQNFDLFNMSYGKSCEKLLNEVEDCWFDYIPATLKIEWKRCKADLEESSKSIDPLLCLMTDLKRDIPYGDIPSKLAWERMVEAVKIFVLHCLVKDLLLKGTFPESPMMDLRICSMKDSERTPGSGFPCKISFSKGMENNVYMIPMVKGISGKLILVEKIPDLAQHDAIAVAPLAGLNPTVDEKHQTWLHLRIREHDLKAESSKIGRHQFFNSENHVPDRRWTLGFRDEETCEAARLLILKEISKQRSNVESLLAPLLQCGTDNSSVNDHGKITPSRREYFMI